MYLKHKSILPFISVFILAACGGGGGGGGDGGGTSNGGYGTAPINTAPALIIHLMTIPVWKVKLQALWLMPQMLKATH